MRRCRGVSLDGSGHRFDSVDDVAAELADLVRIVDELGTLQAERREAMRQLLRDGGEGLTQVRA